MTTAQLSMIAPPPSVAAVLGALTEETRIGQVDFSTRLAPESELDGAEDTEELGETDQSHETVDEARPATEVFTLAAVPDQPVAVVEHEPEAEPVEPVEPVEPAEPVEPVEPVEERPPSIEEIARLVVERMHDAELAMMRHLEALEVEAARRAELATAQAELDAELIRLNARREAHAIVTAARARAEQSSVADPGDHALDEVTESLTRFADVMDELRPSPRSGRTP